MLVDDVRSEVGSVAAICRSLAADYRSARPIADQGPEVMIAQVDDLRLSEPVPARNLPARLDALGRIADGLDAAAGRLDDVFGAAVDELLPRAVVDIAAVEEDLGKLERFESDSVPGFLYEPRGPIPPRGFVSLLTRIARLDKVTHITVADRLPSWFVFDEDFTTMMVDRTTQTFAAGSRVLANRENDEVVQILDAAGLRTVVPKSHPHHFEGADE